MARPTGRAVLRPHAWAPPGQAGQRASRPHWGPGRDAGLSPARWGGPCAAPRCHLRLSTRAVGASDAVDRAPRPIKVRAGWQGLLRPVRGEGRGGRGELFPAAPWRLSHSPPRPWASTCSQARWGEPSPQRPAGSPALRPRRPHSAPQRQQSPSAPKPPRKRRPRGAARGSARRPGRGPLPA